MAKVKPLRILEYHYEVYSHSTLGKLQLDDLKSSRLRIWHDEDGNSVTVTDKTLFNSFPDLTLDQMTEKSKEIGSDNEQRSINYILRNLIKHGTTQMVFPVTEEWKVRIRNAILKRDNASAKAKERKAFKDSQVGAARVDTSVFMAGFMSGKVVEGKNGDMHIQGNTLNSWGGLLAYRISEKEYILGDDFSGNGCNNSSIQVRAMSHLLTTPGIKCWPSSAKYTLSGESEHSKYIFGWILTQMKAIQLGYLTAKLYKEGYKAHQKKMLQMYRAAKKRWPEVDVDTTEIDNLIQIFGKEKQMKEHNAVLKVMFKLSGH